MPDYVAPSLTSPPHVTGGARVTQFTLDSVSSSGRIAAGGAVANTSITFVVVPQSGSYSVQLLWGIGATGPTKPNNVQLQIQNVVVTSLLTVAATSTVQAATFILTPLAGQALVLSTVAADQAEYLGQIIATKQN